MVLVGMALSLVVVHEAWQLYADPGRIQSFAAAVEAGSNIDKALAPPEDTRSGRGIPGARVAPPGTEAPSTESSRAAAG